MHPAFAGFDPKLLGQIFDTCEKSGHVRDVDDAYYRAFITMADAEMRALIHCVMQEQKILRRVAHDADLFGWVRSALKLFALGAMAIGPDDKPGFVKPRGEPPDSATLAEIEARIRRAEPLMTLVLRQMARRVSRRN